MNNLSETSQSLMVEEWKSLVYEGQGGDRLQGRVPGGELQRQRKNRNTGHLLRSFLGHQSRTNQHMHVKELPGSEK